MSTLLMLVSAVVVSGDRPDHRDVSYGESRSQVLDLWVPEGEGPFPCVVYFHGGGFIMGDKGMHDRSTRKALLKAGVAFASVGYRLSSQASYPGPMMDAARSVQFLRANADRFELDPSRFAADGRSAGGAMALWLAMHDELADPAAEDAVLRESSRLQCVAAGSCLATFDYATLCRAFRSQSLIEHPAAFSLFGVGRDETRETPRVAALIDDASPMTHLSADDPDVFLYYAMPRVPVGKRTSPNVWVHHPNAGLPLVKAAKEVDVNVHWSYPGHRAGDRNVAAFLIKRLTAK